MANVTIADAISVQMKAAKPKFVSPGIFQPSKSSATEFLQLFERCAAANSWKDAHKILYFGLFLEGYAHNWYKKYCENPVNAEKTWEDLKADFTITFDGEYFEQSKRKELRSYEQSSTQKILEYYYGLLILLDDVIPQYTDADLQAYFEDGLHRRKVLQVLQPYITAEDD